MKPRSSHTERAYEEQVGGWGQGWPARHSGEGEEENNGGRGGYTNRETMAGVLRRPKRAETRQDLERGALGEIHTSMVSWCRPAPARPWVEGRLGLRLWKRAQALDHYIVHSRKRREARLSYNACMLVL